MLILPLSNFLRDLEIRIPRKQLARSKQAKYREYRWRIEVGEKMSIQMFDLEIYNFLPFQNQVVGVT